MPTSQYHSTTSVQVSISMSMEMSMSVSTSTLPHQSSHSPPYPSSPLVQTPSKKRCRDYVVEEDLVAERAKKVLSRGNGMEVDEEDRPAVRWRSINDLTVKELQVARAIAQEKISQTLYLDPVLPDDTGPCGREFGSTPLTPSPSPGPRALMNSHPYMSATQLFGETEWDEQSSLPTDVQMGAFSREQGDDLFTFGASPSPSSTPLRLQHPPPEPCVLTNGLKVPISISTIATYISQHAQSVLGVFSKHGDPDRLHFLRLNLRCLESEMFAELLQPEDAVELGVLLKERVLAYGGLLGGENLDVWRTILSNNQAQENGKILNGAYVKEPSDSQTKMLRTALLLLPTPNRHLLQFLITFCATVARPTSSKTPAAAARNLATIFGPCLTSTPPSPFTPSKSLTSSSTSSSASVVRRPDWTTALFELLIHAHGLHYGRSVEMLKKANEAFTQDLIQYNAAGMTASPTSTPLFQTPSRLFMISPSLYSEIQHRITSEETKESIRRTPLLKSSGRRPTDKKGGGAGIGLKASAKKLFPQLSLIPVSVVPRGMVEGSEGRNYVSVDCGRRDLGGNEEGLDRERYSKRRRVD